MEENGVTKVLKKQDEIENEAKKFYCNLYANHDNLITESIQSFLGPSSNSLPKLFNPEAEKINGYLTVEEMTRYLKKTKNNASPGSSGFTGDFYKFFWSDIKHFVVNSANHSFDIGSLSIQQRLGIITLLPKGT